jgi:hypothetical protein
VGVVLALTVSTLSTDDSELVGEEGLFIAPISSLCEGTELNCLSHPAEIGGKVLLVLDVLFSASGALSSVILGSLGIESK